MNGATCQDTVLSFVLFSFFIFVFRKEKISTTLKSSSFCRRTSDINHVQNEGRRSCAVSVDGGRCSPLFFLFFVCEAIGIAATPGLLCQPRILLKMIVEKQMECRLAGEAEVLGENLPQRHFYPSQNPT
jgi:hypothetical protein